MAINRDSDLFKSIIKNYWEYYRELEDEFLLTRRYVDFDEKNFRTYSVEYLKLYQAVCSEIDVIGKAMAQIANPQFKAEEKQNNIKKWWYEIQHEYMLTDSPFTYMNPSPTPKRFSLNEYRCEMLGRCEFNPWAGFLTERRPNKNGHLCCELVRDMTIPEWWSIYNKVKHNRISIDSVMINYEKANLGNLASAFAGLYVLERAFIDSVGTEEDLRSFVDFSHLFVKPRRLTISEIGQLYDSM